MKKKKYIYWTVKDKKTKEIWPMWIQKEKSDLKEDLRYHGILNDFEIVRVEVKEVKK